MKSTLSGTSIPIRSLVAWFEKGEKEQKNDLTGLLEMDVMQEILCLGNPMAQPVMAYYDKISGYPWKDYDVYCRESKSATGRLPLNR